MVVNRISRADVERLLATYNQGASTVQLAQQMRVSQGTITRTIRRFGGTIRTPWSVVKAAVCRKYYWMPRREAFLKQKYGVTLHDFLFLYRVQKGLCLWCKAELPLETLLSCCVDHDHAFSGRDSVRGICCPNHRCNYLAGQIESVPTVVRNILRVLSNPKFPLRGANVCR